MVAFKQSQLSGLTIQDPSSLQFGPDGRLYVSQDNGVIVALTVAADGAGGYSVSAKETINLVRFIPNHNDDGTFNAALTTRQVTGLLVAGTAAKPIIYVSSSDPRIGGGTSNGDTGLDTNSGILSRLTKGADGAWIKDDLVLGLPRSEENHAVNGLQINPENGHILLTIGGQTNAGAPSQEFGYLSEYAYGAAIVDIDVAAIDGLPSQSYRGQTYKYALPTVNDPTRAAAGDIVASGQPEVFGGNDGLNQARLTSGSPVQIYATGFRNLYDIAVNPSGQIYGIDNGGNPGWGGSPMYRQANGTLGTTPTGNVTNAINDGSGSINKAPLHLIEKGYYGGHASPIRANPTGAGLYNPDGSPVPLPADWPPVPASMINPLDGYYLPPGVSRADLLPDTLETPLSLRGEIGIFDGSVNGIDDYRASAFSSEMKGDLVAASLNDDSIYRIDLSADGKTVLGVTNLTPTGVLGDGSALDVHAAPETGPFAGTLWVASFGGGITVLTPDASGSGPGPLPQDTDNDGLNNMVDPFPVDATNGQSVVLEGSSTLTWSFSQNEPHPGPGGIGNLGFTGVMTNGVAAYTAQYDPNKTIMGGAASGVLIQDVTAGTPTSNNQTDAYQFGIDIGSDVATYTVTGKVNNPFDGTTAHNNQSVGFFIGTGDQANYIRLVAGAATLNGIADTPVIDVLVESGDVVVAHQTIPVPVFGSGQKAITASDAIVLSLQVDPALGTVTPAWTVSRGSSQTTPGDLFTGQGTAIQVSGELLIALRGNHVMTTSGGGSLPTGLAVGIIGTSEGPGDPFSATWNSINIASTAKTAAQTGVSELIVNPNGALNDGTYNANSLKLNNLSQSGADLKQVVIDLSGAALPDGVFFDPNAAGGNNGKGFQIDSRTGSFTASASYQNGSATTGYRQLTLDFSGFNPGEALGFSLDIDPDSLLGFKQSVTAGSISGAELAGSRVTYTFADGSKASADLFGSGVAQAEARGVANLHPAPTVSLQNVTSGNVMFPAADPSILVQGAPGATVRVELISVAQLSTTFGSPYEGNSATSVLYETVLLDAAGKGIISATLAADRVLVIAAAEVDAAGRAVSAVSPELRVVQQPPDSGGGSEGIAELVFTPNGDLNVSTFDPNTIKLNNLSESGSDLKQVIINLNDAILPDGVFFDPNAAGGSEGKAFQINSQEGSFSASASYQNGSATSGYRQITLDFTGFNPGEALNFSADIDPDSLLGLGQTVPAGGVSGAELAGSHVQFIFADGSQSEADLFGSGVAQAEARGVANLGSTPTLSLQNVSSGNVASSSVTPSIVIQGTAGSTVRVELMAVAQQNATFASAYEGNIATSVLYKTVVLDSSGRGSVSTDLPADRVMVVAAAEVDNVGRAVSAVSPELRIVLQASSGGTILAGSDSAETLNGTSGDDSFDGKGGDDTLNGLAGNDFLNGGSGADRLNGGPGDDVYVVDALGDVVTELANAGTDLVRTTLAAYTLGANVENLLYIGSGRFSGVGNAAVNALTGAAGADRLDGGGAADLMKGAAGNDTYVVNDVNDQVIEFAGQGTDRILSQKSFLLPDYVEELQLTTSSNLNGTGNTLANTLIGNAGANSLDGRAGVDRLTGAGGNDTFSFQRGEANGDIVTDFTGAGVAGGDRLSLVGYGGGATLEHVGSGDIYAIHGGTGYVGFVESIQVVGVTNLNTADCIFL